MKFLIQSAITMFRPPSRSRSEGIRFAAEKFTERAARIDAYILSRTQMLKLRQKEDADVERNRKAENEIY
jgi:hypothetical protein